MAIGRNSTYTIHHHQPRAVRLPMVVGVVPDEPEHYQVRELSDGIFRSSGEDPTVVVGRVLSGMGGAGKTQLAAHHARCMLREREIDLLVWVSAAERMSIVHTYANAAHQVVPGHVEEEPERAAEQFLSWLRTTDRRWLVVLDNVDVPDVVRGLWPPTMLTPPVPGHGEPRKGSRLRSLLPYKARRSNTNPPTPLGRVLVTSRRTDTALTGRGRRLVEVDIYDPDEARAYLSSALTDLPSQPAVEELDRLAEELGRLPLALAQAAAYMLDRRGSVTCTDYIEMLQDQRRGLERIFPEGESLPDDYPWTVATTWAVSIEHADALTPQGLAAPMMRLIALLDPDGIPLQVLTSASVRDYLHHFRAGGEPLTVQDADEAISALERLSLLTRTGRGEETLVVVHRLVQRATRDALGTRPGRGVVSTVADALVEVWPDSVHASSYGQRLRANTGALVEHAGPRLWEGGGHEVMFRMGASLGESGAILQAVDHWRNMVSTSEEYLGVDHPRTFTAREELAFFRGMAGEVDDAVETLKELLLDRGRVLGREHHDTFTTRGSLALWQGASGDAEGAVRSLEELLQDRHRVLGPDHADTVVTRINLAHWRGKAGDAVGALHALKGILRDCREVLGPEDPSTLSVRVALAHWAWELRNHAGAAHALEEVLPEMERVFGSEHPNTLTTRVNLALWRGRDGATDYAARALSDLLPELLRVLGPDHPSTLDAREGLAVWWESDQ